MAKNILRYKWNIGLIQLNIFMAEILWSDSLYIGYKCTKYIGAIWLRYGKKILRYWEHVARYGENNIESFNFIQLDLTKRDKKGKKINWASTLSKRASVRMNCRIVSPVTMGLVAYSSV